MNEKVRIYHHDLHRKHLKRSSILKLQTEAGLLEGHEQCSSYLEQQVADLLTHPGLLDPAAQELLLGEVQQVFTAEDNVKFLAVPGLSDVKKRISIPTY